jgi:hypothetical protein
MTQAPVFADLYSDAQTSGVLPWQEGDTRAAIAVPIEPPETSASTSALVAPGVGRQPLPVPELVLDSALEAHRRVRKSVGRRELEHKTSMLRKTLAEQVIRRDRLRAELSDLDRQIPELRNTRDELQIERVDLDDQLLASRDERDRLVAAASLLKTEVSDLRSRKQELKSLNPKPRAPQHPKPWTLRIWSTWTSRRAFHDS